MKIKLMIIFSLFLSSLFAQWQQATPPGVAGFNRMVESNGQLFALGGNAAVYHSASNGLTWQATTPVPGVNQVNISLAADANLLVVLSVDANNTIGAFQSADNALSWQPLPAFSGQSTFSDQVFVSNGRIYCYKAADNTLLRLDNSVWTNIQTIIGNQLNFAFYGNKIWAGANNILRYSPDNGDSWQVINTPASFSWLSSIAADNNRLVLASDVNVYTSSNNGVTWTTTPLPGGFSMKTLVSNGAWYAWLAQKLYASPDGFLTYTEILDAGSYIQDVASVNGFLLASANILNRSLQSPIDWQWVPTDLTGGYAEIETAGNALFYHSGITVFSVDEGDTWQLPNPAQQFSDVIFHNNTWYARTYYTNEAWQSGNLTDWTLIPTPLPAGLDSLSRIWDYLGNTMVIAGYFDQSVYTSVDNGLSWQTAGALPNSSNIVFVFNNELYALEYGNNELYHSTDFGASWQEQGSDVFGSDNNVYKITKTAGKIYALSDQNLFNSMDGGLAWTNYSLLPLVPAGSGLNVSNIIAFNGGVVAVLSDASLHITQDDGLSWQPCGAGFTANASYQMAENGNTVFVLDNKAHVWRRNNFNVNVSQYTGLVYRDVNSNNLHDAGEPALPNVILQLDNSNQFTISGPTGAFNLFAETHNDVLRANFPAKHCSFNPPDYPVNPSASQLDFGLKCPAGITDLAVTMVNTPPFRPGFFTDIFITGQHLGNDAANGTLTLILDPAVEFINATPFAVPVGNVLTWSFSAFQAFDLANFVVRVKTPSTVPLGTLICHTAHISPGVTDYAPADNTVSLCRAAVGSYDPNDKQVEPDKLSPADISARKALTYTVRFQNTGTYLASLVVVKDTLSPNLDPSTLQILGYSHPLSWSLKGNGIIEFLFDGINLPDMVSDEPGSHGYVQFSIKPKGNLPLGEMTENTAYIYFDFNEPIITNTVTSTVVSTHELYNTIQLIAQPNPATETLRLLWPDGDPSQESALFFLHDASGRLLRTLRFEHAGSEIDVRNLKSGAYQISGNDGKRYFSAKFEVIH